MKRINLFLSEIEERNLKVLLERYGGKAPAFMRQILKQAYEKEYGGYKAQQRGARPVRVDEPELTPEQACEQAGGKVGIHEGIPVCVIQISDSMKSKIPLSKPELFKKYIKK